MREKIKKRLKSRTYWFNHFVAIFGILELNFNLLQSLLGEYYGISYIVIACCGYLLRELTKEPLDSK